MPPVSQAQRAAMFAAAAGNSTLGIPQKVGKEFAEADKGGKLPQKKKKMGPKMQSAFKRGMMSKDEAEKRGYDTDVP